ATGTTVWDNVTLPVSMSGSLQDTLTGQNATTAVTPVPGSATFDCLSWGAVIFSTTVQDTDNDGLLDLWETSTTPLYHPDNLLFNPATNQFEPTLGALPLPNLKAMGADPNVKDIFFEIGYMETSGDSNDAQTVQAHHHTPPQAGQDREGDAYKNAPHEQTRVT